MRHQWCPDSSLGLLADCSARTVQLFSKFQERHVTTVRDGIMKERQFGNLDKDLVKKLQDVSFAHKVARHITPGYVGELLSRLEHALEERSQGACAADLPPPTDIPGNEFENLKNKLEILERELAELKASQVPIKEKEEETVEKTNGADPPRSRQLTLEEAWKRSKAAAAKRAMQELLEALSYQSECMQKVQEQFYESAASLSRKMDDLSNHRSLEHEAPRNKMVSGR